MLRVAAVAAALVGFSMPALADFSGYYAPENWLTTHVPDADTDKGSIDESSEPGSIALIGSDTGSELFSRLEFTIAAPAAGTVSFDWSYVSSDADGPEFDPAGYLLNGAITQLSDNGGGATQGAQVSFTVMAGDRFGFYLQSNDNLSGSATLTISNFSAPIPEPASVAMMSLGLLGVAVAAARRRRSS
jgi:hypothetical protein